ncbi:hypothetical protein PG984_011399 [Apiospora sp. TS-2023a]
MSTFGLGLIRLIGGRQNASEVRDVDAKIAEAVEPGRDRLTSEYVADVFRFVGRVGQEGFVQLMARGLFLEGRKQTIELVVVAEIVQDVGLLDTLMVVVTV